MINTSAISVTAAGQPKVKPNNVFTAAGATLAGPHVRDAVDGDHAIEADADAGALVTRHVVEAR